MNDSARYHAALWNEPLIYQLGRTGRRGLTVPKAEKKIRSNVGDVLSHIPSQIRRKEPPKLPEISEPEVIRHYIRLSQETYGVDSGISLGVGTCTMKYSPKVNESLVKSNKLTDAHPLQDESTVQGILEIMFRLGEFLCEISGMDEFSLQPRAGAHAVLTNARIIKAYHKSKGESEQRNEIITTVLSHPCNGAAPAVAGFKVITLYPDEETGVPDVEALKAVVSQHTAGLMFTFPYDTGVFDPNIDTYFKIIHEAGGLVAIDQANANGVLARLRVGDVGADLCQFNLHKTFSTPHASSGPGSAPIGVKKHLVKFLPVPTVEFDGKKYSLNYDHPQSIGKVASFYGVIPNVVRAYAWILSMGAKGLEETSEVAIINNNYLIKKLLKIRGVTLPWVKSHPRRLQEARFSLEKMKHDTGIGIDEVNCRIVDYGIQKCFTSHEPWIIPEPFTPEPTESTPKEDIDKFVEVFKRISDEAYLNPEILKNAPHNCSIAKIDSTPSRDPKQWALTWRAYLKKHQTGEEE
ncbi:MAG: aminomethyl-transferring glycine dehydrogenase subunit GcvPB [Candidatus Bathyarchaeia archaeon]|jgi:glycine dehydrogenase subunit 2